MIGKKRESKNTFHTFEVVFLIIITCIVSIFMGMTISSRFGANPTTKSENELISKLLDHYQYIKDHYYEEIDDETLLNGAIAGMVEALDDPYSTFIDESDSENFNMSLNGNYSGIGIEIINNQEGNIQIVGVFPSSPAAQAGVLVNDIVIAIDGKDMTNKDKSELTKYVKEHNLEQFTLTVLRGEEKLDIYVKKAIVEIPSVSSKIYEQNGKKIGYIYFGIFSTITDQQFQKELQSLEEEGIESLIIDVRENSGGHLTTATNIVSLFLDQTKVIYQIEMKGQTTKYYSKGNQTKKYPIIILQNGNSASAAELLSGALKESYGATIIGQTSYGKGTVQELVDVDDHIEYKFTTKKWLTPNGNWIHKKGIAPDIEIQLDVNYFTNPSDITDNQLQEALRYLSE